MIEQGRLASQHTTPDRLHMTKNELSLMPTPDERVKDELMVWVIIFLAAVVVVGVLARIA